MHCPLHVPALGQTVLSSWTSLQQGCCRLYEIQDFVGVQTENMGGLRQT